MLAKLKRSRSGMQMVAVSEKKSHFSGEKSCAALVPLTPRTCSSSMKEI